MPLPDAMRRRVVQQGIRRLLPPDGSDDLAPQLRAYGYREQSLEGWLRMPARQDPFQLLERTGRALARSPSAGIVEGLIIFGDEPSQRYMKRWCEPKGLSGRFVARRAQAYGSKRWCFVELHDGQVTHLIDFPLLGEAYRGCDAAWRHIHALDARAAHPQTFDVVTSTAGTTLKLYCPIPMWAERRLELAGTRVRDASCLMAYACTAASHGDVVNFLQDNLWLRSRAC